MIGSLKRLLAHPATRDLGIDEPVTTELRRGIIRGNRFLQSIYGEWYREIAAHIPDVPGRLVELGSGAGFLAQHTSDLITSDVLPCSGLDLLFDARQMPFASGSLKAIAMVDVLHHIPDSRAFFNEARRCLRPGGCILMIEPWVSTWSRIIYTRLHHEPFDPKEPDWAFPLTGPLSGANGALPWIVFERDRLTFESEFPELEIRTIRSFMPFRYLVSGGISLRQLMPSGTFRFWRMLESCFDSNWSMFAFIHVTRR